MIRNALIFGAFVVWGGIGCSGDTAREGADGGDRDASADLPDGGTGGARGDAGTGGSGGESCTPTSPAQDCRAANDARCRELSSDACSSSYGCMALQAARIDPARNCASATWEFTGCGAVGCGALYTVVKDPDGKLWYFPSTCHPDGWTEASLGGVPTCSDDAGAPDSGKAADGGHR
jgi:hypothetical protein